MKQVIITGASSGIGLATAQRFVDAGYAVANLSRSACGVSGVTNVACDLSNSEFLQQIGSELQAICESAKTVTLIHNAARLNNDRVGETDSALLRDVLEVNLVAANSLNQFCLPFMQPGSSILYVGSTLAEKAVPNSFTYVTSKHAVIGMMRATCQDLAGTGIHTACINPGFTDTEMLREHVPADVLPSIAGMSAFERLIQPGEIADTLFFAAGAPVLNGASIATNLGQVER